MVRLWNGAQGVVLGDGLGNKYLEEFAVGIDDTGNVAAAFTDTENLLDPMANPSTAIRAPCSPAT